MNEARQFAVGSGVTFGDGSRGVLKLVVVDPVARALTHPVVEPSHHKGGNRLVPVDLAVPESSLPATGPSR
ncbi:MAG: hypothetical protein QOJ78_1329 [Pseudonocardiales bacterium]|jgi:hypothetical protein|nr:hypothetical protein [Pseudonocardiales bacterium]